MKKTLLILALSLSATALQAQKAIVLKCQYLPKHTYKSTMKMVMDMQMPTGAGADQKPVKMNTSFVFTFDVKAGAAKPTGSFPVSLTYTDAVIKMTMNGAETPMPANPLLGKVIYGESDSSGKFKIDSVSGGGTTDQIKEGVIKMVQQIQDQMKFPDAPIKIGETITQDMPMNIPGVGGGDMKMSAKSTYKLTAVKGDLAYFDVMQDIKMNVPEGDKKVELSGGGIGKMIYSISQKYATSMVTNTDIKFNIPEAGNMVMKTAIDMQTEISAN